MALARLGESSACAELARPLPGVSHDCVCGTSSQSLRYDSATGANSMPFLFWLPFIIMSAMYAEETHHREDQLSLKKNSRRRRSRWHSKRNIKPAVFNSVPLGGATARVSSRSYEETKRGRLGVLSMPRATWDKGVRVHRL